MCRRRRSACRSASAFRPAWSAPRCSREQRRASSPARRCRPGADAVVMQEQCEADGDGRVVRINHVPRAGAMDPPRAARTSPPAPSAARAGSGCTPQAHGRWPPRSARPALPVLRRPRVALFSTGDELVHARRAAQARAPSTTPTASRCAALLAGLRLRGAATWASCPTGWTPPAMRCAQRRAGNDLIITTGGVSVGEEDHVKPAVAGRRPARHLADRHQAGQAAGLRRSRAARWRRGAVHRPAGQSGVELRHLPAGGAALAAAPAGRRRRCAARACRCAPTSTGRGPTSGASSCARASTPRRPGPLSQPEFGRPDLGGWGDGLIDNPPGQAIRRGDTVRFLPFSDASLTAKAPRKFSRR